MLKRIKDLEHEGFEFEAADGSLELLLRRTLRQTAAPFDVDAYHVSMRRDGKTSVCEATVKVRAADQQARAVADGDGPVNALDGALRSALVQVLSQPRERASSPTTRCASSIRRSGPPRERECSSSRATTGRPGATIGVNDNIIEASLQALVDSLEYALVTTVVIGGVSSRSRTASAPAALPS